MITFGFDPGREGGFAIMSKLGVIHAEPLPYLGEELDIARLVMLILGHRDGGARAVVEKVGAMPGQGVCSMFSFGRNVGELRGMLKALAVPFIEPTPQTWKKIVLAGTDWKGRKEASIEHVMRAYPDVDLLPGKKRKAHDGIADAVCLAEYGGRV